MLDPLFRISELGTLINDQWYQELISQKFIATVQILIGNIGTAI